MPTGYALAMADRVLAAPCFQTRQTRTVSNLSAYLRKVLTSRSSAPARSALLADLTMVAAQEGHVCNDVPDCDHAIELLAVALLRSSCLTPLGYESIDELPHASDVIAFTSDVCFDGPAVLTGSRLRTLLDQVPGGAAFYDRVGYTQLRRQLLDDPRFTRTTLGVAALEPYLDDASIAEDVLDAANQLLCDLPAALAVLRTALVATVDTDERASFLAFLAASGLDARTVDLPLYLPNRRGAVAALQALGPASPAAADLLTVLAPSSHRSRTRGIRDVRDLMYAELVNASGLPYQGGPARVNRARLAVVIGQSPDPAALRRWEELRRLLRGAIGQGRGRETAAADPTDTGNAGIANVRTVFTLLSEHVAAAGRLPTLAELGDAKLERIEQLAGCTYRELAARLARTRGWSPPARSRNEQQLDRILSEAYRPGDRSTVSQVDKVEEWSSRDALGGMWRVDTYVKVTPTVGRSFELFCEADGPGHFTEVHNWDLDACRRRDVAKAAALAKLTASQRDGMLVAVHHDLLTGTHAAALDAATFHAVVADARAAGAWWLFLSPQGSDQLRAAPLTPSKLDAGAAGIDAWVVTARPSVAETCTD